MVPRVVLRVVRGRALQPLDYGKTLIRELPEGSSWQISPMDNGVIFERYGRLSREESVEEAEPVAG